MTGLAIAAPILPGKVDEWKEWSRGLADGPRAGEYTAFAKKSGLARVRVWLEQGPEGALAIILYEGETPAGFLQQMATSQEPFAVWFRERAKELHGTDMSAPMGPPPELIADIHAG